MVLPENLPILRKDITDIEWTSSKAFLVTFMSIINVFMFFGNILSIVTICSTAKLRQKVCYWFVMNLAIIDLIISITVVPLNTVWEYHGTWPLSRTTCEFFTFADLSFSTISAYSIVLVSIDKYLYITYSLHYYEKMTRKVALALILAVWVMVLIFATVTILTEIGTDDFFDDHFLELPNNTNICIFVMTDAFVVPSAIFSFFIPFFILCFTSSRIVCIAVRHIKKIHSLPNALIVDSESDIIRAFDKTKHQMKNSSDNNNISRWKKKSNVFSVFHDKGQYTLDNQVRPLTPPNATVTAVVKKEEEQNSKQENLNFSSVTLSAIKACEEPDYEFKTMKPHSEQNGETRRVKHDQSMELHIKFSSCINNIPDDRENENRNHKYQEESITNTSDHSDYIEPDFNSKDSMTDIPLNSQEVKPRSESMVSTRAKRSESIRSTPSSIRKASPYCKLFGTVTIVIACFIIMFAPYNIATVIDVPCHCIEPWVYEDVLAVLYYMHSLVNPYIYMATDRNYKMALKSLYNRMKSMFCCSHKK
ncbi:7 transmembrane receptor (rhodopsin) [Mactra antiquata]